METEGEICRICGKTGKLRTQSPLHGVYCEECGEWIVVTTHIEPIDADTTTYTIKLEKENLSGAEQVRAVSVISSQNFLHSRDILKKGDVEIFSGLASKVREHLQKLQEVGISYHVTPNFPYKV